MNLPDLKPILDCEYSGRILFGNFSDRLKRELIDYISRLNSFDKVGSPSIPYISAWCRTDKKIWYEFTGIRFPKLLDCVPAEVAKVFSASIIDRCIYHRPSLENAVTKETLSRQQLHFHRKKLREQGREKGFVNVIYKVQLRLKEPIWLKDQAKIEFYPEDNICLSRGLLIDVTNEMASEEALKKMQVELQNQRDHLEDMVKDRTKKLWNSQLEIISRLARAAEFRDNRTGRHLAKMSRYCSVLGRAAGLKKNINTFLYLAAPMHDIGKIAITDNILQKAGQLDEAEYELMKSHTHIGAKLLSGNNSDLLRVARTIALNHHERWDGTGYPRGLANQDIPLAGRISAICDVFDALTSERPYKKAWSFDLAINEIYTKKGTHFDPELVDLFLKNLPHVRKIYHEHDHPVN